MSVLCQCLFESVQYQCCICTVSVYLCISIILYQYCISIFLYKYCISIFVYQYCVALFVESSMETCSLTVILLAVLLKCFVPMLVLYGCLGQFSFLLPASYFLLTCCSIATNVYHTGTLSTSARYYAVSVSSNIERHTLKLQTKHGLSLHVDKISFLLPLLFI